jgi:hypothetical protein
MIDGGRASYRRVPASIPVDNDAMHFLLSCFGSAGNVHPFMAIGQALQQRGHRVEVLTSAYFRGASKPPDLDCVSPTRSRACVHSIGLASSATVES